MKIKRFAISFVLSFTVAANAQQYFPKLSLGPSASQDQFKQQWYSSNLQAMQEPSLFALKQNFSAQCYRFLWLRSFNDPVAVRLEPKSDGTGVLTVKVINGRGKEHAGILSVDTSRVISKEQTQSFLTKVNALNFWGTRNPVQDQRGTDGSQWIIEGVKSGRYHVADRWLPSKGAVYELGMFLAFDLARMDIPKNDIY